MPEVRSALRDPAPSRLSYRLQRLALRPGFRRFFTIGLPVFALGLISTLAVVDRDRREAVSAWVDGIAQSIRDRDEFLVREIVIGGASETIARDVRALFPADLPRSSFDLDLTALKASVERLDAVEGATLRVRPGGRLEVSIAERLPALIWRAETGLELLDGAGHRTASLARRTMRDDLPVIAGKDADLAAGEALTLFGAAAPLAGRVRGLVRVGTRRWDLVLDRDQRILLPAQNPVPALQQAIAVDEAQELLDRDVILVDMRNPRRPTVRIRDETARSLRQIKLIELGDD